MKCAQKRALVLALLFAVGCSGGSADRPDTVPVSGTVVYKNQPVEGATVSFMAPGAPRAASGVTDAEGKFQLSTFEFNDGAIVGENVVTISKIEAGAVPQPTGDPKAMATNPQAMADAMKQYHEGTMRKGDTGPKSLLPQKYADPKSSPLKEQVTADGPNTFVFTLTD